MRSEKNKIIRRDGKISKVWEDRILLLLNITIKYATIDAQGWIYLSITQKGEIHLQNIPFSNKTRTKLKWVFFTNYKENQDETKCGFVRCQDLFLWFVFSLSVLVLFQLSGVLSDRKKSSHSFVCFCCFLHLKMLLFSFYWGFRDDVILPIFC